MNESYLKRYTDLPALIYLLKNRVITLLDPESWDDRNDSHYLSVYKNKRAFKSLLALCFTEVSETYHHWRVFAGPSGVCITFDRDALLNPLQSKVGVRYDSVRYLTLEKNRKQPPDINQLPFVKRHAFRDEGEFRIIYESGKSGIRRKDFRLSLATIDRISLSPWTPKQLSDSLKETLQAIPGCENIPMSRSTLVDNREWKKLAG